MPIRIFPHHFYKSRSKISFAIPNFLPKLQSESLRSLKFLARIIWIFELGGFHSLYIKNNCQDKRKYFFSAVNRLLFPNNSYRDIKNTTKYNWKPLSDADKINSTNCEKLLFAECNNMFLVRRILVRRMSLTTPQWRQVSRLANVI